jgi:hypothetical protein
MELRLFRPYRALRTIVRTATQGVALGYIVLPFQGASGAFPATRHTGNRSTPTGEWRQLKRNLGGTSGMRTHYNGIPSPVRVN